MAKTHKYANNGVALDTALTLADLKAICAQAAVESTGDLWNGTTKLVVVESGDDWIRYQIPGALRLLTLMTFSVKMTSAGGRSTLETDIENYYTTQTTVMFIPVTPKKMVARHGYLQFINKVANTVREADPSARIAISEGEWTPVPVLPVAAVPSVTAAVAPTAALPPPPPPPPLSASESIAPAAVATAVETVPVESAPVETAAADERTQKIQRRPRAARWLVAPQGMTPVPLVSSIVMGRSPSANEAGAQLITVPRSEDTVSKSHARLELVNGAVVITDLGSINGTILVSPDEQLIDCEPHVRTPIPPGYVIELGDFVVSVEPEGSVRR